MLLIDGEEIAHSRKVLQELLKVSKAQDRKVLVQFST